MPDGETPQFRVTNERDPIPPVDLEDLKRRWKIQPGDNEAFIAERIREVDSSAILHRDGMIRMLTKYFNKGQLLAPWQPGAELDDAVFRVAGKFPIRRFRQNVYKVPVDSVWEFDPKGLCKNSLRKPGSRIPGNRFQQESWKATGLT